ncbi:hypothetical protein SLS62_005248 [Diatrype stigma]|uniref:Uncharacterized protein n=1 Tax=Diatrype stigma TaxID=117547 RepID=A0AAN9URK0_9PEZI
MLSSTQDAGDVSPIDEIPDMSQLTTGPPDPPRPESRTGIPQLRRERRQNADAAAAALRQQQKPSDRLSKQPRPYGHDVRWDPNTGEPTTSNKGRPSQVDPREFAHGLGNGTNTSVSPRHIKQAQQSLSAFGERVRRMRGPSESAQPPPQPQPEPAPRPEWRGASGRAPLAPPLKDSHHVAPLRIPPKSDKRTTESPGRGPSTSTSTSTSTATVSANTAAGPRNISSPLGRSPRTEESNSNGGGAVGPNNTIRSTNQTPAAVGQQLSKASPASAKAEGSPPGHHPVSTGSFAAMKHADPPRPRQQQQQPASSKPPALSQPEPPTSAPAAQQPPSSQVLHVPTNEKATKRKSIGGATATGPAAIGHKPHPSGSSSVYSQPDIQPARTAALATAIAAAAGPPSAAVAAAADDWVQPPSRFSVTTYGTSNPTESYRASTDYDYDSDAAPPLLPPPPITDSPLRPSSAASGSSIMERGRPIVPGYEKSPRLSPSSDPVRINLGSSHPAAPQQPSPPSSEIRGKKSYGMLSVRPVSRNHHEENHNNNNNNNSGNGGGEKDLPPAPPELEASAASNSAADRVARLNARLQALGNRRINLHTAIRQMTELMPTDSVLASDAVARKREAEKRKVEALRRELADVERESYDLGLSLHRAYKRLDREAEYEPTGLWVRRVTG